MCNISGSVPAQPTYVIMQEPASPIFNRVATAVGSGLGSASAVHAYNITTSIVNDVRLGRIAISTSHYIPARPIIEAIIDTHKYNFALIIGGVALAALCFKVAHDYS